MAKRPEFNQNKRENVEALIRKHGYSDYKWIAMLL
jgi:hypothetical protein